MVRMKMPKLWRNSKGDLNPGSLDWGSDILSLCYRAPERFLSTILYEILNAHFSEFSHKTTLTCIRAQCGLVGLANTNRLLEGDSYPSRSRDSGPSDPHYCLTNINNKPSQISFIIWEIATISLTFESFNLGGGGQQWRLTKSRKKPQILYTSKMIRDEIMSNT